MHSLEYRGAYSSVQETDTLLYRKGGPLLYRRNGFPEGVGGRSTGRRTKDDEVDLTGERVRRTSGSGKTLTIGWHGKVNLAMPTNG